jgi:two-component system phosphate regulon response regulator OmpR
MSAGSHILVVDDDDRIRELLKEYLAREGFRVTASAGAIQARKLIETFAFDLLVLDVMMPGEDGMSLARWVRSRGQVPILMLTAKAEAESRIEGLALGADDYLSKPFEPQELSLRIAAILRRSGRGGDGARSLTLGEHAFDLERAELSRGGKPVRLTEGEARLLKRLAQSPHMPVDRGELIEAEDALGRGVDVQVTRLRRKIEPDPKNPRYLQTVRGVGYRLAPD